MHNKNRLLSLYGVSLTIIFIDQASKFWAQSYLNYAEPNELLSWLNFTLHYNRGAAFSFLSDAGGWQRWLLSVVALGVSMILAVWLYKLRYDKSFLLPVSLSFILGGAIGNLWDRLELGYVVDFISVYYNEFYFPTFNVADSAISVGALLLIWDSVFSKQ